MDQLNKHAMSDLFSVMVIMIYSIFFQGFSSLEKKQTEAPLLDMFHICFSFSLPGIIVVQMTFWSGGTQAANEVFVCVAQINQ